MVLTPAFKEQSLRKALDRATILLLVYQSPGKQEPLIDLNVLSTHGWDNTVSIHRDSENRPVQELT